MVLKYVGKVFGFAEKKRIKKQLGHYQAIVGQISALEPEISALSDEELKKRIQEIQKAVKKNDSIDEFLIETFAIVREAGKRTVKMRPFDVQLIGGIVLHEGKIAEMATGEGKTLVATLPASLNSFGGKCVHIVTVNDYLAKRDAQWMGPIYHFLGLKVGILQHESAFIFDPEFASDNSHQYMRPVNRSEAYQADVVYGTNSEFGFDYLRDNMVVDLDEKSQKGHGFAIVDEVDSILIDEARTPLIISGPAERAAKTYRSFAKIIPSLKENDDYEVDEKLKTVSVTETGIDKVEHALNLKNLYDNVNQHLVNHLVQALKAHALFKKDVDYVVKDGEVILVDEFTGRLMEGRRYSEGLHQAIEAKEQVAIQEENQTLATITIQNYFRMYKKLAGMTGTAYTESDEFIQIYNLEPVRIPTNKPLTREEFPDLIYKTEDAKFSALVKDIKERYQKGQPLLIGTIAIEKSEKLSKLLRLNGVRHEVLNAKQHEREAQIISQAGHKAAVTVATNMAGRGVDIILGGNPADEKEAEEIKALGGLHVIGTERHEARRIDNQLRGRSGRQGDPGSSQFYISCEDDLMRLFAAERIQGVMERFGFPDDMPIEHPLITRSIETAQKQVESQNFEIRKHVLEYDDVMNKQREIIYEERDKVLAGQVQEIEEKVLDEAIDGILATYVDPKVYPENWDLDGLFKYLNQLAPLNLKKTDFKLDTLTIDELKEKIVKDCSNLLKERENQIGVDGFNEIKKMVMLQIIDYRFKEHLADLDYLKEAIGLRAIGQRDPLVEFKNEAFQMFQSLIYAIKEDFLRYIFHVEVASQPTSQLEEAQVGVPVSSTSSVFEAAAQTTTSTSYARSDSGVKKVGRNDPCPCGSGKKYKKCCGQDI